MFAEGIVERDLMIDQLSQQLILQRLAHMCWVIGAAWVIERGQHEAYDRGYERGFEACEELP